MRFSRALSRFVLIGCIVGAAAPFSLGQGGGERPQRGAGGLGGGGGPGGAMRGGFGMLGGGMMGGGGMASLLGIKEVRDELKMDEEQTKEFESYQKEVMEERRAAMAAAFGSRGGGDAGGPGGGAGAPGGGSAGGGRGGRGGGFANMSVEDRQKMQENMKKMQENMAAGQAKSETKLADILDPAQMDRLVGLYVQRDGVRTLRSKTVSTRLNINDDQKAKISAQETAVGEEMFAAMTPGAGADMQKVFKESEEKVLGMLTSDQKTKMEEMKGAKFEFPAPPARGGPRGQ